MKEGTMIRKELHIRPVLAQRKLVGAGFSWPTLVLYPVIASITISKFTWIEDFPVGSRSPTKDPSFDSFHNNRHIAQELPALAEWKSPAPIRIPIGTPFSFHAKCIGLFFTVVRLFAFAAAFYPLLLLSLAILPLKKFNESLCLMSFFLYRKGSRAFLPATSEITNDPVVLQLIMVGE
ncbi:hypothetical protein QUC31_000088 [Theobroma cacao]|uniref:Uncharacterized protein n=1 Tax=Theobroma cacao TaxID=3641 RepID=A0A061FB14_THECC|nr:Uncharacterized protein TCM_033893 [Theobroma cacao]